MASVYKRASTSSSSGSINSKIGRDATLRLASDFISQIALIYQLGNRL